MRSDKYEWKGRVDSPKKERIHQVVQTIAIEQPFSLSHNKKNVAILGFCCDEGVKRNHGRPGAYQGPDAIRDAMANLPCSDRDDIAIFDAGNIFCNDGDLETAQKRLGRTVTKLLQAGATPLLLGGGHEIAWGHYQGIEAYAPDKEIAVVNIDAHYDLRPLLEGGKGSSGTSFTQIAESRKAKELPFHYYCIGIQKRGNTRSLIETAENLRTRTLFAEDLSDAEKLHTILSEITSRHELIYFTLCMDVFAAPYAPGVSAPQPLGLTPWQVVPILHTLAESGKVISFDIAEVSPPLDQDNRTARLAAVLLREFISYIYPINFKNRICAKEAP